MEPKSQRTEVDSQVSEVWDKTRGSEDQGKACDCEVELGNWMVQAGEDGPPETRELGGWVD